jgi:hypothetical protein
MEQLTQFTHIGRMIDPRYPTNLAIMIWSMFVGALMLGFRLISGIDIIQAGIASVVAGLAVFATWAISREIDPQEQLSAFVSVTLMTIALFIVDVQANLLVLFYLMPLLRIVSRSTGLPAKVLDSVLGLLYTAFVGFAGSWIYAMMGATALLLDSLLPDRDRKHLLFAGLSVVIMVIAFLIQNNPLNLILPTTEYIVGILITTFIFAPVVLNTKHLTVIADITNEPLIPIRVQATQVIALLFGYHVALWQGNQGVFEFLPLWLSIAGVSLFPLIKPLLPDWDLSERKTGKLKLD